jgi:hypothetical protein
MLLRRSTERNSLARSVRRGAVIGTAVAAFATTSLAFAGFNSLTSGGPTTISTKRIFPAGRTTPSFDIRDASAGGAEANLASTDAYTDGLLSTTGNWDLAFSSSRYLELDYNNPLPGGLAVSGASFKFTFSSNASGDTACFYFEVRRTSTDAVIGTHGSTGSPVACDSTGMQQATTTSIPEVSTTDVANDLRIRVYAYENQQAPIFFDLATVSGSTPYSSFTLYEVKSVDASTGSPATTQWGPAVAGDGATYQSASVWATAFSSTQYLKFAFPAYVPTGATVTAVTFNHTYRAAAAGADTCYYFEVYDGAALLGTHGSTSSPVSCNSSATTYVTDDISLTEVNSVAHANNVLIKLFVKSSGSAASEHDLATLTVNYYRD